MVRRREEKLCCQKDKSIISLFHFPFFMLDKGIWLVGPVDMFWSNCSQKDENDMIALTMDGCECAQGEYRGAARPDKCGMWPVTSVWLCGFTLVASHLCSIHHSATKGY